jgi:hypothetical protein
MKPGESPEGSRIRRPAARPKFDSGNLRALAFLKDYPLVSVDLISGC